MVALSIVGLGFLAIVSSPGNLISKGINRGLLFRAAKKYRDFL